MLEVFSCKLRHWETYSHICFGSVAILSRGNEGGGDGRCCRGGGWRGGGGDGVMFPSSTSMIVAASFRIR